MTHASQMLESHPAMIEVDERLLAACVEAADDCAQAATACADACLGEEHVAAMVTCVRACLDCADLCGAVSRVLSRSTETDWRVGRIAVEIAAATARACGEACDRWAEQHEHCRLCAETCRRC